MFRWAFPMTPGSPVGTVLLIFFVWPITFCALLIWLMILLVGLIALPFIVLAWLSD